jgi:cell division protein FtsI/penicillin-binding protein 2
VRTERRPLVWAIGVLGAAAVALAAGCGSSGTPPAAPVSRAFLADLAAHRDHAAAGMTDAPRAAARTLAELERTVAIGNGSFRVVQVDQHGSLATAGYVGRVPVSGLGTWRFHNRLSMRNVHGRWLIHWGSAVVIPGMRAADRLVEVRSLPQRASILDRSGRPLFVPTPVVTIGVVPKLLGQRARTLRALDSAAGLDPARVRALVTAAAPEEFVPLITLRRADYQRIRARVHPLPGVHFLTGTQPLAPTRGFARPLLGFVGPATADALRHAGPLFTASDQVGLAGLQLVYQRRLAGTPTGRLVLEDKGGRPLRTLFRVHGHPGQPVDVTLDRRLQTAAERALDLTRKPAALVAVQASTGDLLAVANRPVDSFDRALTGLYPPGSAFKVVSATALLSHGITPATNAPCRPRITVNGKTFVNFEHESFGNVPFALDFARSCNTAFIGLAPRLTGASLARTATLFGIGIRLRLPVPAASGQVPLTSDPVEHAADMIGQGRVLASPLAMALAAAAAAAGRWHPPRLVASPRQPASAAQPPPLPATAADSLRQLMRLVVTRGTGTAADLPGSPVYGKTGTAEYGNGNPPPTHAWFIGYRDDVAFAVIVENGGVGGRTAARIAAGFLRGTG